MHFENRVNFNFHYIKEDVNKTLKSRRLPKVTLNLGLSQKAKKTMTLTKESELSR